jgi:hypothetical protein
MTCLSLVRYNNQDQGFVIATLPLKKAICCVNKIMKSAILLLCLMNFVPFTVHAQWYRHKSEDKIARMAPAQRVDEYVKENTHHYYDVLDDYHGDMIEKYIRHDGLKALPRIIEIMDEYDPTRSSGRRGNKAERFDNARRLFQLLDNHVVRLRASDEGKRAIDALGRVIERMRAAGYTVKKDGFDWNHSTLNIAIYDFNYAKGVNSIDNDIQDTFRFVYKIVLSDTELLEFSNYLTAHYPEYPSWSDGQMVKDDTELSPAGLPVMNRILKKPERYYEAYLEFKKTKKEGTHLSLILRANSFAVRVVPGE